jgi:hypothetical protein
VGRVDRCWSGCLELVLCGAGVAQTQRLAGACGGQFVKNEEMRLVRCGQRSDF